MRFCTFNVRGLSGKAELVQKLFDDNNIDIIGLTETWQRPTDRFLLPLDYTAVTIPPSGGRNRGTGGIALAYKPGLDIEVVYRAASDKHQIIVANTPTISIVLVYISPVSTAQELKDFMNEFKQYAKTPAIVMGDFNARNLKWDKSLNPRGTALLQWAEEGEWTIHASTFPTYSSITGSSNVDLFVTKGVNPQTTPWIPHGPWIGSSDHSPIVTDVDLNCRKSPNKDKRVAWYKRKDERILSKVKELSEQKVPSLTEAMRAATSISEMNKAYKDWEEILTDPFIAGKPKPRRFKDFWNVPLDRLAKKRTRLYKRAQQLDTQQAWDSHKETDKRIKQIVRLRKREQFQNFAEGLQNVRPGAAQTMINRISRIKKGYAAKHCAVGLKLDPEDMTNYIHETCQAPRALHLEQLSFAVSDRMAKEVHRAVKCAPINKAPGPDLLIGEALKTAPETHGQFLVELWRTCGRLKAVPSSWMRSTIVPLHKKGEINDPANYRPIALLSHARKIIESALDSEVRKEYQFNKSQFGFQHGIGTEAAITHTMKALKDGYEYAAVLDLKAAYDRVPRDKLSDLLRARLPSNLHKQIVYFLGPSEARATGDNQDLPARITRGVPQGSPLSPAIFNIFMDTLAERVNALSSENDAGRVTLFADDVKLRAKTREFL